MSISLLLLTYILLVPLISLDTISLTLLLLDWPLSRLKRPRAGPAGDLITKEALSISFCLSSFILIMFFAR